MAENKQYITQILENGNVMISEDVVFTIAEHALTEVEGFAALSANVKNWGKGMKIVIAEDNSLTIDCNVLTAYGYSVVDVADAIQTTVASAVESMTGVKVKVVNVNVCGIARQ